LYCKLNRKIISVDNSSFKIAYVKVIQLKSEAEWSNHEQVENSVEIQIGGLNSFLLKKIGMTCG